MYEMGDSEKMSLTGIVSPGAISTYMLKQGLRTTVHMVKSLEKKTDFSLKIRFQFKFLKIVVRKNRLLCPIPVRKNMLLCLIHVRKKWLPVQYKKDKMVTHLNLDH